MFFSAMSRVALFEVGDRLVELAHRDVAVPAVAIQADVVRVAGDTAGEDVDRVAEAVEVRGAAPQPDRGVER